MESNRIDDPIAALNARLSRRGAAKFLGVGAIASLAAASGPDWSEAKRKKRKKKPTTRINTCAPGTLVGSVNVPANGTTVTTPFLVQNQPYRLRAAGFWSTNAEFGNDAYAAFKFSAPGLAIKEFEGTRLGLSVANGSPDDWGAYTANHIYERRVVGRGDAISLRNTDPITNDNVGAIVVDVFCD